jgi:hypothetical protein
MVALMALSAMQPTAVAPDVPPVLDASTFARELDALSRDVATSTPDQTSQLRARLPHQWSVQVGRTVYRLDSDPLLPPSADARGLPAWTERRQAALDRLASLRAELQHAVGAEPRTDAAVYAALQQILASREFASRHETSWASELQKRIQRELIAFLDRIVGNGNQIVGAGKLLAVAVALAAMLAAGWWGFARWKRARRNTGVPSRPPMPPPQHWSEWAARTRVALDAGDSREAAHCAFHAVLHRLEERGAWKVIPSRTPREYSRLLGTDEARTRAFRQLVREFETSWYGGGTGCEATQLAGLMDTLECPLPRAI